MRVHLRIGFSFFLMFLLFACSTTKYVPDGSYLLDNVVIQSANKEVKAMDLKPYLRQIPNFKMFGLLKTQLYIYNASSRDSARWLSRQLRKTGEQPVILDAELVEQSKTELQRYLVNSGYLHAAVTAVVDTADKKATVTYNILPSEPYKIKDYVFDIASPIIDSIAHLTPDMRPKRYSFFQSSSPSLYTTLVQKGALFDRSVLDQERQRITSLLRQRGFYTFNRDHIAYDADSSLMSNQVDLTLRVKPLLKSQLDGTTFELPHNQYHINNVTIVTDYDPLKVGTQSPLFSPTDTLQLDSLQIIYGENGRVIRPNVLRKNCFIEPGELFNERNVERTYAAYSSLSTLKNVNVRFKELAGEDSLKLDCYILTSQAKIQSFGVDLEGTHTAGNLGFASSFNYQHRNIFKGSEIFKFKIRGAYEGISGFFDENFFEIGGETSLIFPSFVFPFLNDDYRRSIRATSDLQVSYNYQKRPEYDRTILSGGWGYSWQGRANNNQRHSFKLIDIDYVYLPRIDSTFKASLPPSTEMFNYSDQFIVGSGYTFSFSNFNPQYKQRSTMSMRATVELAGNLLYGISSLTKASKDAVGNYSIFGINYSQFAKGDFDFSKTITLDARNSIAYHAGVGIAVPYGNASTIPFERRYFGGGANGVRGWSVRSLGPGAMPETTDAVNDLVKTAGDIRLDLNIEYRTRLFWKLQLAAYVDAGNIWTIRDYDFQPGGCFYFDEFYKQIAVSYGLGLRLDFDFFLLRFDTGMKAYNPQKQGSDRWVIRNPNFKTGTNGNFAWHFAVGYPF